LTGRPRAGDGPAAVTCPAYQHVPTSTLLAESLSRQGLKAGSGGVGIRGLREFMRLPERDGRVSDAAVSTAYAELSAINMFKWSGHIPLREAFPGFVLLYGKAGRIDWRHAYEIPVTPDGSVRVTVEVGMPPDARAMLDAMVRKPDPTVDRPAVAAAVEAVRERLLASIEPRLNAWRKRLDAGVLAAGPNGVRYREVVGHFSRRQIHKVDSDGAPNAVLSTLERSLSVAERAVSRLVAEEGFASAVGYAGFVDRMRASRPPRRVVLHVGPTNSGKTHDAMLALSAAPTGAYLAPLRLLALEGHERLLAMGLRAGMLTGEESVDCDGATHLSQTVETADLAADRDTVVIDEVQMLMDPERGWAWSRAVFGMRCRNLILAGSPDAVPLVRAAAAMLGETVEVVRHERMGGLALETEPVGHGGVRTGDAVVAFTRREVYFHREVLAGLGHRVATVYGGLSPDVRRAEAARFASGEAGVLVATDAIGMGLNLPVRRVVFSGVSKFDGRTRRHLHPSEIRQIAGRAGRYGLRADGRVAVLSGGVDRVARALDGEADPVAFDGRFGVRPDVVTVRAAGVELGTESLGAILAAFKAKTVYEGSGFKPCGLERLAQAIPHVDWLPLSLDDKLLVACCPLDMRDEAARHVLRAFAEAVAEGRPAPLPEPDADDEVTVRVMGAYLWMARRWPASFPHADEARAARRSADAAIEALLREGAHRRVDAVAGIRP